MNSRPRSLLILGSTLLVGMVLGALLHAALFDKRVKRVHGMATEEGFVESFMGTIRPESGEQEAAIQEILVRAAQEVSVSISRNREVVGARLDAMSQELEPLLTQEQAQRLSGRRARHRRY